MGKFKVVTSSPKGAVAGPVEVAYALELEALAPIGAEIVVADAGSDEAFLSEARDADAIISGHGLTATVIDGLERCRVIAVGSVGTDGIDIARATESGIPVTNRAGHLH